MAAKMTTEPSKQNLQTCASLSTVTPTAAPLSREPSAPARRRRIRQAVYHSDPCTYSGTRSFRTCEADKET
ncbi:hypothetical protein D4764_11G0000470 [Takifugu flavidus]|uniref:Uncharacterized protein n=1 Tax=Takifugu flavidus TaxID=433684 RepID=A0A5C6PG08_9TELE|nr:hypothetical protein D4764_11G0000470 [Takifugu flavidus]